MRMTKFSTCFSAITVMLIFLQNHLVASLSPILQKTALFQFKQSLTISAPTNSSYDYSYEIPSYPKTMNWSMSSDHCTWEGVTCEHQTGHVIGLDLSCSGLEGAILPNSTLFQLSHLHFLNLSNNDFSRSNEFPQEFGSFAKGLTHLNLSRTGFRGRVPSGISHLYKLVSLDLSYNYDANYKLGDEVFKSILQNLTQLRVLNLREVNIYSVLPVNLSTSLRVLNLRYTGLHRVLPQEVFHLPNIELLALGSNPLQVVLPKVKWGSSDSLQHLSLPQVDIYGGIPDSLQFLDSLATLELSYCNLSGPIPRSIGNLGQLTYLGLGGNNFNDPIPKLLANLTNLRYLSLFQNNFTGPLPTGLFNHPSLEVLDLSYNGFTGQLYESNSSKSQLVYFDCHSNLLYGRIPQSLFQLVNLTYLDISYNEIEGEIPATLSNFRNLETINLNGNRLEGRIPSSFAEFHSLKVLDLGNNEMNDTFPECLEALPYLQVLVLKSNKFHGIISKSSEVEHPFPSLRIIDLSYNEFSGPLPAMYFQNFNAMMIGDVNEVEDAYIEHHPSPIAASYSDSTILVIKGVEIQFVRILTVLTTIDLSRNNFEGEIPEYIGKLILLRSLNLSHNHLTGNIPSSIGKLSVLESLDLSSNQLEGEIPRQLTSINTLQSLNVSCNQLDGKIPEGSQFNTFDSDSYVGNIGLCGYPLSKECEHDTEMQKEGEDDDYFFSGFTWEAVVIGYGCGVVPAFIIGNLMLLAGKPKWFAGIIARELGLKIRRMEIRMR